MGTVAGASGRDGTSADEATSSRRTVGSTPTIYDVARVAGAATSTVSRALSSPGG
jgi:Bacterial regulatory proteins, lacI family